MVLHRIFPTVRQCTSRIWADDEEYYEIQVRGTEKKESVLQVRNGGEVKSGLIQFRLDLVGDCLRQSDAMFENDAEYTRSGKVFTLICSGVSGHVSRADARGAHRKGNVHRSVIRKVSTIARGRNFR